MRSFHVFAKGNSIQLLEEQVNKMIDEGFTTHGFAFSEKGVFYQNMHKPTSNLIETASQAYLNYINGVDKIGEAMPFKPKNIPSDRANG